MLTYFNYNIIGTILGFILGQFIYNVIFTFTAPLPVKYYLFTYLLNISGFILGYSMCYWSSFCYFVLMVCKTITYLHNFIGWILCIT